MHSSQYILLLFIIPILLNYQAQVSEAAPQLSRKLIYVKIALFFDSSLQAHLDTNFKELIDMSQFKQAYVTQMDAIIGGLSSNSIARIKIKLIDPAIGANSSKLNRVDTLGGDVDRLLSDFCLFQAAERAKSRDKWDVGILLTQQDLFSSDDARISSHDTSASLLGISPVGGIAWPDLSCLLTELGVGYDDKLTGSSYPTRGLASTWTATHELAHNLGIHHDGFPFNLDCNDSEFIMSSGSELSSIARIWSNCSSESLDSLSPVLQEILESSDSFPSHELNYPTISLDLQCRFFASSLRQPPVIDPSLCNETIKCVDGDGRFVGIGPALEGTRCRQDDANWGCRNGKCSKLDDG